MRLLFALLNRRGSRFRRDAVLPRRPRFHAQFCRRDLLVLHLAQRLHYGIVFDLLVEPLHRGLALDEDVAFFVLCDGDVESLPDEIELHFKFLPLFRQQTALHQVLAS